MRVFVLSIFVLAFLSIHAQFTIKGVVINEKGEKLSFATVFLENTSIAASTNEKGEYVLSNVPAGTHSLKVTYIGYRPYLQAIHIDANMYIDVQLKGEIYNIDQIEIQATRVCQQGPFTNQTLTKSQLQEENVAFNSGGAHCLKYGMTANHILGIKAVLATGEVVEWGGGSRERLGPDWCGLFTGNEGLFGIALEITLQLLPKAECFHTVRAGYRTLEQAGDAVSAVIASGLLPGAIEVMDALALEAAKAAVHAEYPPGCEAVLIVELEGPHEVVAIERERLDAILSASSPVEMRPARDAEERLAIWKGRKSAFSAVGRLSPDFIVQDGVVPRRRLGEALRRIAEMSQEPGLRVANVFHAGDGNLHPLIPRASSASRTVSNRSPSRDCGKSTTKTGRDCAARRLKARSGTNTRSGRKIRSSSRRLAASPVSMS